MNYLILYSLDKYICSIIFISSVLCAYNGILRLNQNKEFTISQITDLHYGESVENDTLTSSIQMKIFETEHPDFVVFTGDCVSGNVWNNESGWFQQQWNEYTKPVTEMKIPYALTLGNHDADADLNRQEVMELDMKNPYSMSKIGIKEITGVSNYYIPVYDNIGDEIVFILWFFDTMSKDCYINETWGCIGVDTVNWYRCESTNIYNTYHRNIPGLAFFHIPLQEYMEAANINEINGVKDDPILCPKLNSGLFAAMVEQENILATFCGHNHMNDYTVNFKNINLHFGRKTGVSPEILKSRIIKLNGNDLSYSSYIRNEDGLIETYSTSHRIDNIQLMCVVHTNDTLIF